MGWGWHCHGVTLHALYTNAFLTPSHPHAVHQPVVWSDVQNVGNKWRLGMNFQANHIRGVWEDRLSLGLHVSLPKSSTLHCMSYGDDTLDMTPHAE